MRNNYIKELLGFKDVELDVHITDVHITDISYKDRCFEELLLYGATFHAA